MTYKTDANGILVLDGNDVEEIAEHFLAARCPRVLEHPSITPLAVVEGASRRRFLDSARELVVHRVESAKPRSLIEWQANRFAAAILVPRATIEQAINDAEADGERTSEAYRLRRTADRRLESQYDHLLRALCAVYQVSKAVMRIRLRELHLLDRPTDGAMPQHISVLLPPVLERIL